MASILKYSKTSGKVMLESKPKKFSAFLKLVSEFVSILADLIRATTSSFATKPLYISSAFGENILDCVFSFST